MQRSLLFILDGESLRTPGLAQVLERDGWEVHWAEGFQAQQALAAGAPPDLLLFDPATISDPGLAALAGARLHNPGLPVVALGPSGQDEGCLRSAGLVPTAVHRLGRNLPPDSWPATLRSCLGGFGPGAQKFTAEDLFGDILADMEGPQLPPPVAPLPAAAPVAALPVGFPPAGAPQAMTPEPSPVQAGVAPPASAPELSALFARIMEDPAPGPAPVAVPPPEVKDFTLSGISGIQDPFGTNGGEPPPALKAAVAATLPPVPPAPVEPPADYGLEEFGNYYLLEKIAVGGMAELFKARQRGVHNFEKIVAIKRILPHLSDNDEFVRMFIDEAKLAAQLTHPNIAQIFDLGKAGGFYYIAMEFVDGRDLRSLLRKVREYKLPLPEAVAASVTMKVANALDYAHRERGINDRELKLVHRDISPQNILISYDGGVKLVDFGIAKAATKSTQTMAGALKGKLLYMSPEQALGQAVDGRSDLYSLGLVLFELLTGERCFQADSEMGVLEKVRLGKVLDVRTSNPAVSAEMAAILDKVLQKNVEQRYASARLLERDLKALLVRNGNEPTEHDIAEYVNTLLKGTREDLETLLTTQFPAPPPAAPWDGKRSAPPMPEEPPVAAPVRVAPSPAPAPPRPPDHAFASADQPAWLIPALAGLALAVVLTAWFILR